MILTTSWCWTQQHADHSMILTTICRWPQHDTDHNMSLITAWTALVFYTSDILYNQEIKTSETTPYDISPECQGLEEVFRILPSPGIWFRLFYLWCVKFLRFHFIPLPLQEAMGCLDRSVSNGTKSDYYKAWKLEKNFLVSAARNRPQ